MPKIVVKAAPKVLGMAVGFCHAIFLYPVNNLKIGDNLRPSSGGDGDQILNVVKMTVGNQNIIRIDRICRNIRAWIAGEEGVNQNLLVANLQTVGTMPNIGVFDSHFSPLTIASQTEGRGGSFPHFHPPLQPHRNCPTPLK